MNTTSPNAPTARLQTGAAAPPALAPCATAGGELLHRALARYRENPRGFGVPNAALEVFARCGTETSFILLGTKDFAAVFVAGVGDKARVRYVVDDFKVHRGERFAGLDVISVDRFLAIAAQDPTVIALNCCRFDDSKRFFDGLCREYDVPCLNHEQASRMLDLNASLDSRVADWGPTISARFDEFTALQSRLGDAYSVETLQAILAFHLTCDPEFYLQIARPYSSLYFRSGLFAWGEHEKMVDCGASIGESTKALIGVTRGRFGRSWMIEPDKFNIATLQKLLRRYDGTPLRRKLALLPFAVGEFAAEVAFHHQGGHSGSIAPTGAGNSEPVQIRTIDALIDEAPTFIKMDIEGFEMPALRGAVKTIQASRPKLAISAYHRADDLLDITHFVDSVAPGYRLGLRHHTEDRWDTCLYFYA